MGVLSLLLLFFFLQLLLLLLLLREWTCVALAWLPNGEVNGSSAQGVFLSFAYGTWGISSRGQGRATFGRQRHLLPLKNLVWTAAHATQQTGFYSLRFESIIHQNVSTTRWFSSPNTMITQQQQQQHDDQREEEWRVFVIIKRKLLFDCCYLLEIRWSFIHLTRSYSKDDGAKSYGMPKRHSQRLQTALPPLCLEFGSFDSAADGLAQQ